MDANLQVHQFPTYKPARDTYKAGAPQGEVGFYGEEGKNIGGAVFGNITFALVGKFTSTTCEWKFEGEISTKDNIFNFNDAERPFLKEKATRFIGTVGYMTNAKQYNIIIDGSRKVTDGGSL